jgi:antitoxin (DNA-binding transcriptional repressor) of toxin-antitoxin stability system
VTSRAVIALRGRGEYDTNVSVEQGQCLIIVFIGKGSPITVTDHNSLVIKLVTVHIKTLEPRLFVSRREVICPCDNRGRIRYHDDLDKTQFINIDLDSK